MTTPTHYCTGGGADDRHSHAKISKRRKKEEEEKNRKTQIRDGANDPPRRRRVVRGLLHRRDGGGDPLDIAVVETGHADPAAGDEVDTELLAQTLDLGGAQPRVAEHATLG